MEESQKQTKAGTVVGGKILGDDVLDGCEEIIIAEGASVKEGAEARGRY